MQRYTHPYICASLAGVLMGGGLLHPALWLATLVGVGVFFWGLRDCTHTCPALMYGWVSGGVATLVSLSFFFTSYPLPWVPGLSASLAGFLLVFNWLYAACFMGLGTALFAAVYQRYITSPSYICMGVTAVLWVVSEYVSGLFLVLSVWGPGSVFTGGFSFGQVGYALAQHGLLIELAAWGGVYALSFLVVFGVLLVQRLGTSATGWSVIGVMVLGSLYVPVSPVGGDHIVGLLQTNIETYNPEREAVEVPLALYQAVIVRALAANVETLVFPEDTQFTPQFGGTEAVQDFLTSQATRPFQLVDTSTVVYEGTAVLRSFTYNTEPAAVHTFDKQYLVPFGEYVPYIWQVVWGLTGTGEWADAFLAQSSFVPGDPPTLTATGEATPAVLFCYESTNPLLAARSISAQGQTSFIAHPVSHSRFLFLRPLLQHQLDAMLRVQAVQHQLPIVMAGNFAQPTVYLPNGTQVIPTLVHTETDWVLYSYEL